MTAYRKRGTRRIFLFISCCVLLVDVCFVGINYFNGKHNLDDAVSKASADLEAAFELAVSLKNDNMLQMTTFISTNEHLNQLFLRGKKAVEREGGGAGGPEAAALRKELLDAVSVGWSEMQRRFKLRQLHYHLGPGSVSYLRVHKPGKFGDRMDEVRYTIVDTNATQRSHTGFETGRVYSGLRSVVPIQTTDPDTGKEVHVGALETGTSYSRILDIVNQQTGGEAAVLLTREHVERNMWPEAVTRIFEGKWVGDLAIEATSDPSVREVIGGLDLNELASTGESVLIDSGSVHHGLKVLSLRDYRGQKHASLPDAGVILLWHDATQLVTAFRSATQTNIVYAVVAFVVVELIIFFGLGIVTSRLEAQVDARTETLRLEIEHRDRLLGILSHDLRTPFNAIYGFSRELAERGEEMTADERRQLADTIVESSENFLSLLSRLLEWMMASGSGEQQRHTIRVSDIAEELVDLYGTPAAHKGIALYSQIPAGLKVHSDPNIVATVLRNFVSNALKFTASGSISLTADKRPEHVSISVVDTGVGMDDDTRKKLFKEKTYSQIGTDGEQGSGVSMNLCATLASQIDAELHVASTPGEGSTFTLRIAQ